MDETNKKLAGSLTADSPEMLPYLPFLLQDLWELGTDPGKVVSVLEALGMGSGWKALDLGCGKGAVSIRLASHFGCSVKGVDLMDEFIEYANRKARELSVSHLCEFVAADINEAVKTESGYDLTVLGAVGSVMGSPEDTVSKLKNTIKPGGCIIIDDGYIIEAASPRLEGDYYSKERWESAFKNAGLTVKTAVESGEETRDLNDSNTAAIEKRAAELMIIHPQHRAMFERYLELQRQECDDMEDSVVSVMWLLRVGK